MKDTNMLIEIPNGFLLIEKKGAVDEYPGIFVSYSKDGKTADEIIAAIEYDTINEIIKTITYETHSDEPTNIIKYPIEATNDELTFVDTRKNAILGIGDDYVPIPLSTGEYVVESDHLDEDSEIYTTNEK